MTCGFQGPWEAEPQYDGGQGIGQAGLLRSRGRGLINLNPPFLHLAREDRTQDLRVLTWGSLGKRTQPTRPHHLLPPCNFGPAAPGGWHSPNWGPPVRTGTPASHWLWS